MVSADVPPEWKTGTRVRSPKPPFYETALLSPSEFYHKMYTFSVLATQLPKLQHLPCRNLSIAIPHRRSQLDALRSGMQPPESEWQHFKSRRLQDANAARSQMLAFDEFTAFHCHQVLCGKTRKLREERLVVWGVFGGFRLRGTYYIQNMQET